MLQYYSTILRDHSYALDKYKYLLMLFKNFFPGSPSDLQIPVIYYFFKLVNE